MDIFRDNIRSALRNETLQIALDKNAEQRLVARDTAYRDLPEDFQTLKHHAHAVRADVIDNLDEYLFKFTQKAQENGIIVHHAADAEAARDIVLKIAKENKASLIAKSKTMMSEEIELNSTLEDAGFRVVETDLGEYIVQLREEHPSHIITPAVHLRREEVGETFHKKLGIELTDDIQILTNTARSRLRQTFLDTDIGISGVNLGVVETGALCIVTNEGNGRMVTTLPDVHIALMGIERLVSNQEDLALILKMLPRSSTGQKITVYTQLISGPRRSGEVDGARERHLVLIDNGRSELRRTSLAETLYCIRCGACINVCPVFREIGGYSYTSKSGDYTPYPGPIGSALSPGLFNQADFGHLAQASTLCGACKEACPIDIDLPQMLLRVRSGGVELKDRPADKYEPEGISTPIVWGLQLFTWASTRPRFYHLAQKFAALLGKIWSPRSQWMYLPPITGWGYSKDFPRPAGKSFRERWQTSAKMTGTIETDLDRKHGVVFDVPHIPQVGHLSSKVSRFESELTALNGNFIQCSQEDLGSMIIALLEERHIDQVLSWDSACLPTGLIAELQANGIQVIYDSNPNTRLGITGADAAIAETGTLVITSSSGRPLSTSLLPEIHIAVLHETNIYENLLQVLQLQEIQDASNVVMISGPSRTADIEMTLTIGVHGPGEIFVFCVRD